MKIGRMYTIDFTRVSKIPKFNVSVKAGDSKRTISLILLENNIAINLDNYTVTVAAKKSDGTDIFNDVKIIDAENGVCEVEVTKQMLATNLDLPCEIILYGADGTIASSSNFVISKISSVRNEESIVSSSEFTALSKALTEVKNIDNRFKEVDSQIKENENKFNEQINTIQITKANITDLTNDRVFKGSDTTSNILSKESENGDYWFSTDENVYYLKGDSGWINIGYGDNKINSIIEQVTLPEHVSGKYLTQSGNIVTGSEYFKCITLEVNENDRFDKYEVSGKAIDTSRLIGFFDKNNKLISIFPNSQDNVEGKIYNHIFEMPSNCEKIIICSHDIPAKLYKIPNSQSLLVKHVNENVKNLYDYICDEIKLNSGGKYLNDIGTFTSTSSESFKYVEFDVNENERYIIKGNVIDEQRLYSLVDVTGKVVKTFPNVQGNITLSNFSETIKVERGIKKIRVCSYLDFINNVTQLPILSEKLENKETSIIYTYLLNKVMCIGDSLTMGAYYSPQLNGRSIKENYPYYFSKINKCEVVNEGESGLSVKEWWGARNTHINDTYDTFVIWLGTNGGLTDTLDTDFDNLETNTGCYCAIIDRIKEVRPNANIFLLNVFATSGDLDTTNKVIKKISEKYDLPVFDMNDGSIYNSSDHDVLHPFNNNVHFGKIGNLTIAKKVTSYINNYIKENPSQFEEIYIN